MLNKLKAFYKNNKSIKYVLYGLSAFLGVCGFVGILKIAANNLEVANLIIIPLVFILLFLAYSKTKPLMRREKVFCTIFSVIASLILVLGTQLEFTSQIYWTLMTLLKIICTCFATYPLVNIFLNWLNGSRLQATKGYQKFTNKKIPIIIFCIIAIGGLLGWLALFPGVWECDVATSLAILNQTDIEMASVTGAHWSIPVTMIYNLFLNLGNYLFGSQEFGIAIYSFLQMMFLSYVAMRITYFAFLKTKNVYLLIFAVLFFTIFPFYIIMTVYIAFDPLFSGIFALIVLNLFELIEDKTYWRKKYKPIILGVLCLLLCFIRNNGVLCLLIALPIVLVFCRQKRLLTCLLFILPVGLYCLYRGPILNLFHITTDTAINESLSVPSQQIGRVYTKNHDVITQDEEAALQQYYNNPGQNFLKYIDAPMIADYTKGYLNNAVVKGQLVEYVSVWLSLGLKDPINYIEAFLINSLGFWYPNKSHNDTRVVLPYFGFYMSHRDDDRYINISRNSLFPAYEKVLESFIAFNNWKKIPVLSTLTTPGIYLLVFIFLIGLIIVRRRFKYIVPLSMIIGLYVTILLGPVAIFRYSFPIIICWPILIAQILQLKGQKNLSPHKRKK